MSIEYQLRFPEYFPPLGLYPAGFSFASHLKVNNFGRHTGRRNGEMVIRGGPMGQRSCPKGEDRPKPIRINRTTDTLKELAMFSPVYNMISKSLPVEFDLEKI